jgi:hypothetical protein
VDLETQEQASYMQESMSTAVTNGNFLSSVGLAATGSFTIAKK